MNTNISTFMNHPIYFNELTRKFNAVIGGIIVKSIDMKVIKKNIRLAVEPEKKHKKNKYQSLK